MTFAAAIPCHFIPAPPAAQGETMDASVREHAEDCFAVILSALGRAGSPARQSVVVAAGASETGSLASPTPVRGSQLAAYAVRFVETGVFGLMRPAAYAAASTTVVSPSLAMPTAREPSHQQHTSDKVGASQAITSAIEIAAPSNAGPVTRPKRTGVLNAHADRVIGAAATMRPSTLARGPSRCPQQSHRSAQRDEAPHLPSPAPAQTNAVHVAIAATEHGLQVFARVGRMEPTERARLRHAAASLLAQYGHHGAAMQLDERGDVNG
jgi:hypothetical protein